MKLTVLVELTMEVDGESKILLADLLAGNMKNGRGTMLTDNAGLYDYSPKEVIKEFNFDA